MTMQVRNSFWQLPAVFLCLLVVCAKQAQSKPLKTLLQDPIRSFGQTSADFSPDSNLLAAINGSELGYSDMVKVWDVSTKKEKFIINENGGAFSQVLFSPDGRFLTAVGKGINVKIWESTTGKELKNLEPGLEDREVTRQLLFSPDGERLYVLSQNPQNLLDPQNELKCWNVSTGKVLFTHRRNGSIRNLEISRDGKTLVAWYSEKPGQINLPASVRVWDAISGTERLTFELTSNIPSFTLNPKGDHIALIAGTASPNPRIETRSIANGKLLSSNAFKWYDNDCRVVTYSPDGKYLAVKGAQTVRIWDTSKNQFTLEERSDINVHAVVFSPDSKSLAAGFGSFDSPNNGSVKVWEPQGGKLLKIFTGMKGYPLKIAYSPNGKHLYSNSTSGHEGINIWNLQP